MEIVMFLTLVIVAVLTVGTVFSPRLNRELGSWFIANADGIDAKRSAKAKTRDRVRRDLGLDKPARSTVMVPQTAEE